MLDEMKGNKNRLKQVIKQLAVEYDFLFIDCPPGFSALSENIFNGVGANDKVWEVFNWRSSRLFFEDLSLVRCYAA